MRSVNQTILTGKAQQGTEAVATAEPPLPQAVTVQLHARSVATTAHLMHTLIAPITTNVTPSQRLAELLSMFNRGDAIFLH